MLRLKETYLKYSNDYIALSSLLLVLVFGFCYYLTKYGNIFACVVCLRI